MREFKTTKELYEYLLDTLDEDLELKGKKPEHIDIESYGISRRQYFYMKDYLKDKYHTKLKIDKLEALVEKLGLKIKITYEIFK